MMMMTMMMMMMMMSETQTKQALNGRITGGGQIREDVKGSTNTFTKEFFWH
jgi:hypothetical protein